MDVAVHRHGHDETLVVVGVVAEHFEPARGFDHVRWRVTEVLLEDGLDVGGTGVRRRDGIGAIGERWYVFRVAGCARNYPGARVPLDATRKRNTHHVR